MNLQPAKLSSTDRPTGDFKTSEFEGLARIAGLFELSSAQPSSKKKIGLAEPYNGGK